MSGQCPKAVAASILVSGLGNYDPADLMYAASSVQERTPTLR
jgi:hypothetical protein